MKIAKTLMKQNYKGCKKSSDMKVLINRIWQRLFMINFANKIFKDKGGIN